MDIRAVVGGRPTGEPGQQVVSGIVSSERPAPASFTDPLYIVVPSHSAEIAIEFVYWPAIHGATLPVAGTLVTLGHDETGTYRVLGWDGSHT
jgi:hypothetical protein